MVFLSYTRTTMKFRHLPWLFAGLVLFLAPAPASALDCYSACMDASNCWSTRSDENVSYCSGIQVRCSAECRNSGPGGGPKSYGAIAYSKKNGAYGYAHGWTNQKKAEAVALKNCKENGSGCKKIVWYYNSCGAVASDGRNVTWGQAGTSREAVQQALDKCNKKLFKGKCENKVYDCSGV